MKMIVQKAGIVTFFVGKLVISLSTYYHLLRMQYKNYICTITSNIDPLHVSYLAFEIYMPADLPSLSLKIFTPMYLHDHKKQYSDKDT